METYRVLGQPILLVLFNIVRSWKALTLGWAASPSLVRFLCNGCSLQGSTGLGPLVKLLFLLSYDTIFKRLLLEFLETVLLFVV